MSTTAEVGIAHRSRARLGPTLGGEVLEIGPGIVPFPTAPDAAVTYADRSLPGGRDDAFPELVGLPSGPPADVDLDLDLDGLGPLGERRFDVVIASHVIEHLAAPIAALREMRRVLAPGGRLVLVVPDRTLTFDAGRSPTPLAHLLAEHAAGVSEISVGHIREFCAAIHAGPPIHPAEVRDGHDPDRLDAERIAWHRRRTIHVHCWRPEELAAGIAGLVAANLVSFRLADLYLADDEPCFEFGLVLEADAENPDGAHDRCVRFVEDWCRLLLGEPARDRRRLEVFAAALRRDLHHDRAAEVVALAERVSAGAIPPPPAAPDAALLTTRLAAERRRSTELATRLASAEHRVAALERSRAYLAGRLLTAPLRVGRRRGRGAS
jgi:SAM-dependent methyltransferase